MSRLVGTLDRSEPQQLIDWSCPIPFFGHLESAQIGTVGINPSNREFVGIDGSALAASHRRFPTLASLGLGRWGQADYTAVRSVIAACSEYFERNPYDGWFGPLDKLLSGTGCSYYQPRSNACHLDIVPWATPHKWGVLKPGTRRRLVDLAAGSVASMIEKSPMEMLVLNGQEVIRQFQTIIDVPFAATDMPSWSLPRRNGAPVPGTAYTATIERIAQIPLGRRLRVVGYNHNIQSSFGVTTDVRSAISGWIAAQQLRFTA